MNSNQSGSLEAADNEKALAPAKETQKEVPQEGDGRLGWGFRLRLFFGLALPIFLETLDYTIVATAQPHIASAFGRLDLQSWIGTAYLLTSTVFLPLYGSFADIFGRHWALQTSLVWFTVGSALSTGAQNMPMMLAGRGIAGVGAAGFLTVVRVILADSRSLNENTFLSSMMIVLYSIGYCVGPTIGGALTSVTFRWVFGINLPCAALGMALLFVLLRGRIKGPQPSARQRARQWDTSRWNWLDKLLTLDFVAACLFIAGGILILLALTWGSTVNWSSARVIVSFVIGGLLLIACLGWEWLIEHYDDPTSHKAPPRLLEAEPLLPFPVFKSLDTNICQFASFTGGMVMLVAFYFVAIFFTIVSGEDPTKAGIQLIYFAPGMGGGVLLALNLIRYFRQPKIPIILGSAIIPVALGLISHAIKNNQQGQVNGFMAMAGVGVGLGFAPLGIHARFSQPTYRLAVVESLQLFFRTLGGTVGLAQCGAVMNAKVKSFITDLIVSGKIDASQFPQGDAGAFASIQAIQSLPPDIANAIRDAYRNGTQWAFISLIPWTGITFLLVIFLSNIEDTDRKDKEQKENTTDTSPSEPTLVGAASSSHPKPSTSAPPSDGDPEKQTSTMRMPVKPSSRRIYGPFGLINYLVRLAIYKIKMQRYNKQAEVTQQQI